MFPEVFFFKSLVYFLCRILFGKLIRSNNTRELHRSGSNAASNQNDYSRYQKFSSLSYGSDDLSHRTVLFDLEGALLRSSSPFPYFMLVAFEAGSFVRALLLLLSYPLVALLSDESGLKVMVFVSFFGVKAGSLRVGSAVLPKFFMEDLGLEGFEVMRRSGRKVVVSSLPQVMIESFLRDYLGVDAVLGKEIRVFCGHFLGLMEEKIQRSSSSGIVINGAEEVLRDDASDNELINNGVTGVSSLKKSLVHHHIFSHCKVTKPSNSPSRDKKVFFFEMNISYRLYHIMFQYKNS